MLAGCGSDCDLKKENCWHYIWPKPVPCFGSRHKLCFEVTFEAIFRQMYRAYCVWLLFLITGLTKCNWTIHVVNNSGFFSSRYEADTLRYIFTAIVATIRDTLGYCQDVNQRRNRDLTNHMWQFLLADCSGSAGAQKGMGWICQCTTTLTVSTG